MVYECLQCNAPQAPGAAVCPHCGAAFSGPVPADAYQPEPSGFSQASTASTASLPNAAAAATFAAGPSLNTAPNVGAMPHLGPAPDLAQSHAPPPPAWVMPTIPAVPDTYRAPRRNSRGLVVGGVAAAAVALGGVLYLVITGAQNAPAPADTFTAVSSSPAPLPAAPSVAPAVLAGSGSPPNTGDSSTLPPPVGRWMDKQFDYYEFDDSGTGSRGNVGNGKPAQTFNYTIVKKQIIFSLQGSSTQKLPFSYGPGETSLYLRQPDGRYLEFTRQG